MSKETLGRRILTKADWYLQRVSTGKATVPRHTVPQRASKQEILPGSRSVERNAQSLTAQRVKPVLVSQAKRLPLESQSGLLLEGELGAQGIGNVTRAPELTHPHAIDRAHVFDELEQPWRIHLPGEIGSWVAFPQRQQREHLRVDEHVDRYALVARGRVLQVRDGLVRRGIDAAVAPANHKHKDIGILLDSAAAVLDCGCVRIDGKRRMLREQRPIAHAFDELAKIVADLPKIVEGRADHDTRRSGWRQVG